MLLVNETNVSVSYTIMSATSSDSGTIPVNGVADLPAWDNQSGVTVYFTPFGPPEFTVTIPATQTGNEVEMFLSFA